MAKKKTTANDALAVADVTGRSVDNVLGRYDEENTKALTGAYKRLDAVRYLLSSIAKSAGEESEALLLMAYEVDMAAAEVDEVRVRLNHA